MQHYRLDRITSARLEANSFARDPGFDLSTHAARAFGSFHTDAEIGEVIWRFVPAAAPTAREFLFHPELIREYITTWQQEMQNERLETPAP